MEFIVSVIVTQVQPLLAATQKCWFLDSDVTYPYFLDTQDTLGNDSQKQ